MIGPKGYAAGLSALCLGAVGLLPGAGQSQDGGMVFGLTLSEQLRHENGETSARTDLGLTFDSQTRSQRLSFDLGSGLELPLSGGGDDLDVADPRLRLDYALERRDTLLEFDLSYSRVDIDDVDFLAFALDPLTPDDTDILVIDGGQRENVAAGISLILGRTAPFGARLTLRNSETNYLGGATQTDSRTVNGQVELRFDLTPTATAFLDVSALELDRDGGVDVDRRSFGASLDLQVTPALIANLSLSESRVETNDGVTRLVREGAAYGVGLTADRPNGTLGGQVESEITENGRRTSLRFNRSLTLPRGRLSGVIGISRNEATGNTDPLYNLAYTHDLPRGVFSANFNQRVSSSTTGAETLATQLQLSLRQDLTEVSSISARVNLRESNQTGSTGTDLSQYGLSVEYDRQITRDWSLFGGINHTVRQREGQSDTTDDTVFIGLRTAFEWRP